MKIFKKKEKKQEEPKQEQKAVNRFETIDKLGIKRRIEIHHGVVMALGYDQKYDYVVDADELESILKKAFELAKSISEATGHNYAKFEHKDAVSKEELSEALKQASEDLKIFKSSDVLANLAKRIKEAGVK